MTIKPSIEDTTGCIVDLHFKYVGRLNIETKIDLIEKSWEEIRQVVEELTLRFHNVPEVLNAIGYNGGPDIVIGCNGFTSNNVSFNCDIRKPRIDTGEKMTCGRRDTSYSEVFKLTTFTPPQDTWMKVGEDRVCSYCGSLHPEDFEKIIDLAISSEGKLAEIGATTKGYKIYARRKEVINAGLGGIKFYTQHIFGTMPEGERDAYVARTEPKLRLALSFNE